MGIRAMPWGPPPKGAHQTSKNNAYQQKSVAKNLILHVITTETFPEEECGPPKHFWKKSVGPPKRFWKKSVGPLNISGRRV